MKKQNRYRVTKYCKPLFAALMMLILLMTISSESQAQDVIRNLDVKMGTPEATAMARYGNLDVSLYKGVPNISVPLHTLQLKGFSLPIGLNYDASGIKVEQRATDIGLGWSLNFGGSITQATQSLSDLYYPQSLPSNPATFDPTPPPGPNVGTISNQADYNFALDMIDNANKNVKPDLFYFSGPFGGGKFLLQNQSGTFTARPVPYRPLDIEYSSAGFTIQDEAGNKYVFHEKEIALSSKDQNSCSGGGQGGLEELDPFSENILNKESVTWYLSEIVTANKDVITFTYTTLASNTYRTGFIHQKYKRNDSATLSYCSIKPDYTCQQQTTVSKKRISSIENSRTGQRVEFTYSTTARTDFAGNYELDQVKVKQGGTVTKTIDLTHSYFNAGALSRLKLDKVQIVGLPAWEFEYETAYSLPSIDSFAQDEWGYYNGQNSNTTLVPNGDGFIGANRSISTTHVKAGSIKSMRYPTGGKTVFSLEAHPAGGGLRIASIVDEDGAGTQTGFREFKYVDPSTGLSSRVGTGSPNFLDTSQYYFYDSDGSGEFPDYTIRECNYDVKSGTTVLPLHGVIGIDFGYKYVVVNYGTSGIEGREIHRFSSSVSDLTGTLISGGSPLQWGAGELMEKTIEKWDGTVFMPLQKQVNSYSLYHDSSGFYDQSTEVNELFLWGLNLKKLRPELTITHPTSQVESSYYAQFDAPGFYRVISGWYTTDSTTTYTYDPTDVTNFISTTKAFEYNLDSSARIKKTTDTNSDGQVRATHTEYVNLNIHTGLPAVHVLSSNALTSNVSSPSVSNTLGKTWNTWSNTVTGNTNWNLKEIWQWKGGDPTISPTTNNAIKITEINRYDLYGNPTEVTDAAGIMTKYYYGTNSNPFAQSSLHGTSGTFLTGIQQVNGTSDCSFCNTRPTGAGVDDLFTEAEYNNKGLMTYSSSPSQVSAYYVYDSLNRLTEVKNDSNLTVGTTSYNYVGTAYSSTNPNWIGTNINSGSATRQSRQYADGLGRPIQSVALGDTDVVIAATDYDAQGRNWKGWKPFYKSGSSLTYDSNYTTLATTAHGSTPYAESIYEASPASRPSESIALGGSGNGKVLTNYGVAIIDGSKYAYTESTDPENNVTRSYSDGWGRTVRTSADPSGINANTHFVYDKRDLLTEVRHPNYFAPPSGSSASDWKTSYSYDDRGLQSSKTSNDFGTVSYVYDKAGRIRFSQTANQASNNQVGFVNYDGLGRIAKTGVADGVTNFSSLNPDIAHAFESVNDHLKGVSAYDEKPATASYPWSEFSTQITSFTQNTTNVEGQMSASIYRIGGIGIPGTSGLYGYGFGSGQTETLQAADTLSAGATWIDSGSDITFEAGKAIILKPGFVAEQGSDFIARINASLIGTSQDGVSSLTGDNPWQLALYDYDNEGRVSRKEVYTGNQRDWDATITYTYNRLGEITRQGTTIAGQTLYQHYGYNNLGQLKNVILTTDGVANTEPVEVSYTYTASGALNEVDYRGGAGLDYAYDIRDWVTDINSTGDHFDAGYTYNKNGNIATSTFYNPSITLVDQGHKTYTTTYSYDNLNRLTQANYDAGVSGQGDWFDVSGITYDKNGNITGLQRKAQGSSFIDNLSYTYSASNRLASIADAVAATTETWDAEDATYGYDANGNMTSQSGKITSIIYDERNLPVHTKLTNGHEIIANYDAGGYRVVKEVKGGTWEYHLRDGDRTLAVIANDTLSHFNLYGGSMFGQITTSSGTLSLSSGQKYFLQDHLGSTRETVNGSNATQSTYDYYAFGALMPGRSGGSDNTLYKYTGHERDNDADLNLDYMMARTYDPAVGRFLQRDPALQSHSSYAYVDNNPLTRIDPDGMEWEDQAEADELEAAVIQRLNHVLTQLISAEARFRESGRHDGKAGNLANELNSKRASLNLSLNEISQIGNDKENVYRLTDSDGGQTGLDFNPAFGGGHSVFRDSDGVINIEGSNSAYHIHEIRHVGISLRSRQGLQFDPRNGNRLSSVYQGGLQDEIFGYIAQYSFDPNSLPIPGRSFDNSNQINEEFIFNIRRVGGERVYEAMYKEFEKAKNRNKKKN